MRDKAQNSMMELPRTNTTKLRKNVSYSKERVTGRNAREMSLFLNVTTLRKNANVTELSNLWDVQEANFISQEVSGFHTLQEANVSTDTM
jgi:hypothetical protein